MRRRLFTLPRHLPERIDEQVHLRADRRVVVPQVGHLSRQGAEPDAVLSPAGHVRRVEPRLRLGRLRAIPVRGSHRGGRGVQEHHVRHPALGSLLVPQRVQAVWTGKPSAAELPDSGLERLRRLSDQAGTQRVSQRTRPQGAGIRRSALHRQGQQDHRRDLSRHVPAHRRVDSLCAARSIPPGSSPPTWPDVWSCSRWCTNGFRCRGKSADDPAAGRHLRDRSGHLRALPAERARANLVGRHARRPRT